MAQKKIRLKGHETFILREGWLTKGILEVSENQKVFSENFGADALGVGSNMAKAIRYWLRESGLMTELQKIGAKLTNMGKLILDKDAYFEDDFSLWLVHCNLAMNAEKVTSWYGFFNLLESEEFTREELEWELKDKILLYSGAESVPERSLKDDCNAILSMYFRENEKDYDPEEKRISPFAHLGLVRKNLNRYKKVTPNLNTLSMDVILYILAKHKECTGIKSISIDDLVNGENLPGKILNLNRTVLNKYLDELADENCLTVNRTAGLDMVYLGDIKSLDVAARHYEKGQRHEKFE
ncbi:MAG: DUF4007 family protein [Lachnospiraceae bacterium]|nr:DUF4007 family protein [Lachnospiraceae bacterium]